MPSNAFFFYAAYTAAFVIYAGYAWSIALRRRSLRRPVAERTPK